MFRKVPEESSSLCVCNMPGKVLPTLAVKGMEASRDRHGPRSSSQELHLKRLTTTKNTNKNTGGGGGGDVPLSLY